MSGFLQRLVSRSLAPAPVHPRARLDLAWATPPDAAAAQTQAPAHGSPAADPPRIAAQARDEKQIDLATRARATAAARPAAAALDDLWVAAPVAAAELARRGDVQAVNDSTIRDVSASRTTTPPTVAMPAASADSARHSDQGIAQTPPPPLLPAQPPEIQPQQPPAAMRDASARRAGDHTAASTATVPDVHIHIGRIELTALAAPADARRKPARAAPATLSLDDYLRGRRGAAP